jgi:hypothetical protein
LTSLTARCYNTLASFEESALLRDRLTEQTGYTNPFLNEVLFEDEFEHLAKFNDIPHMARCVAFVGKH